jgi:hypothetical protein
MNKEERAFRRMIVEALVEGPENLTRQEIHAATGISHKMVAEARNARREKEVRETRGEKVGRVTCALARKRRRTATTLAKIKLVKAFYEEKSTPTANSRDVRRYWVNGPNARRRELHQKRLLSNRTVKLHQEFVRRHGPISRGVFFALKPQWVVSPTEADRRLCLCIYHLHVKFAMEDAEKNCRLCNLPYPTLEHYTDIFQQMLCDDPKRKCIKEDCDECGLKKLQPIFKPWKEATHNTFKYRSIEKNEKGHLIGEFHEPAGNGSSNSSHAKASLILYPLRVATTKLAS